MKRISTGTKVTDKFGPGKHGFRDGDAVNGVSPTDLEADLFDHFQEELCHVIEFVGGTVNGSSKTQLREAIASMIAASAPAGSVIYIARNSAPAGFLKANGAAVSRTTYAALFAAIGTTFGAGDGSTTFNLPDLRGEFLRGWDDGRGLDAGRVFGSAQSHSTEDHKHITPVNNTASSGTMQSARGTDWIHGSAATGVPGTNNVTATFTGSGEDSWLLTGPNIASGTGETRPRNIALLPCIKY